MKNFKFSRQTIFTLLGILVIIGSIPLAVILVKQRQEIRKEAASSCCDGRSCGLFGICRPQAECPSDHRIKTGLCPCKTAAECVCCQKPCGAIGGQCCAPNNNCSADYKTNMGATFDCPGGCWKDKKTTGSTTGGEVDNTTTTSTSWSGRAGPLWHRVKTGKTCSAPKATNTPTPTVKKTTTPTNTPTPTLTVTPTITPTITPTLTVTPTLIVTPTITVGCDQGCTTDSNCSNGLICSSGRCRNKDCTSETDCICPSPTATPMPTATSTPSPTATPMPTTALAQATPTPVVELPSAGFSLPTFGTIFGGVILILLASVLFLL